MKLSVNYPKLYHTVLPLVVPPSRLVPEKGSQLTSGQLGLLQLSNKLTGTPNHVDSVDSKDLKSVKSKKSPC